jgi:hypothetical protein
VNWYEMMCVLNSCDWQNGLEHKLEITCLATAVSNYKFIEIGAWCAIMVHGLMDHKWDSMYRARDNNVASFQAQLLDYVHGALKKKTQ